jgi:hypothetical protein
VIRISIGRRRGSVLWEPCSQTLADGTHITHSGEKGLMYRDSAGRTRNELTHAVPIGTPTALTTVIIFDPVAGFRYQLTSREKVARRFAMPAARSAIAQPTMASTPPGSGLIFFGGMVAAVPAPGNGAPGNTPRTTSESLGSQLIEGVTAEGTRTTTTWAVGLVGNDREIIATSETWYSKQLGVAVLTKSSDPRSGDTTIKLTDITLVEPDPALFMPPADYEIKDMGGPTINH